MKINLLNIPKAILYFFIGTFVNLIIYFVISPEQGNLIGIVMSIGGYEFDRATYGVVFGGIMIIGIIVNIFYPIWTIFDEEEENE